MLRERDVKVTISDDGTQFFVSSLDSKRDYFPITGNRAAVYVAIASTTTCKWLKAKENPALIFVSSMVCWLSPHAQRLTPSLRRRLHSTPLQSECTFATAFTP